MHSKWEKHKKKKKLPAIKHECDENQLMVRPNGMHFDELFHLDAYVDIPVKSENDGYEGANVLNSVKQILSLIEVHAMSSFISCRFVYRER